MAINKVVYGNKVLIDLTTDSISEDKLLKGYTAHDKSGANIVGTCDFDANTKDATVTSSEILEGKTAYANGSKIIGTMPNRGSVNGEIRNKSHGWLISQGYHDGGGSVHIAYEESLKIIPSNIKSGISILGVMGSYEGSGGTYEIYEGMFEGNAEIVVGGNVEGNTLYVEGSVENNTLTLTSGSVENNTLII